MNGARAAAGAVLAARATIPALAAAEAAVRVIDRYRWRRCALPLEPDLVLYDEGSSQFWPAECAA